MSNETTPPIDQELIEVIIQKRRAIEKKEEKTEYQRGKLAAYKETQHIIQSRLSNPTTNEKD